MSERKLYTVTLIVSAENVEDVYDWGDAIMSEAETFQGFEHIEIDEEHASAGTALTVTEGATVPKGDIEQAWVKGER